MNTYVEGDYNLRVKGSMYQVVENNSIIEYGSKATNFTVEKNRGSKKLQVDSSYTESIFGSRVSYAEISHSISAGISILLDSAVSVKIDSNLFRSDALYTQFKGTALDTDLTAGIRFKTDGFIYVDATTNIQRATITSIDSTTLTDVDGLFVTLP